MLITNSNLVGCSIGRSAKPRGNTLHLRVSPETAPRTPSIEVISGCRSAHRRAPKRHGAPRPSPAGFRRQACCEGDHGATGGGSPSGAGPRGRRAPPQENAADSARRRFFARLHCCAIHAESHSVPERRYSTKAEGAGGGPAHIGLVSIDSLTGPRDGPLIAPAG